MQNFWIFLIFMFVGGSVLSFTMDGTSGLFSSSLSAGVTSDATRIPVLSSSGFSSSGGVIIDDEDISYSSIQTSSSAACPTPDCLVVATRGDNGTTATPHGSGARVYSRTAGLTNIAGGFRATKFQDASNPIELLEAAALVGLALFSFAAKAIMWDFSFLEGNMIFVKFMLLYPLSGGFVVGIIQLIRGIV